MPQDKKNFDPILKDSQKKPKKNTKMKAAMKQIMYKKAGRR